MYLIPGGGPGVQVVLEQLQTGKQHGVRGRIGELVFTLGSLVSVEPEGDHENWD